MIAVSFADYDKHGCPECNYKYANSNMSGGGASVCHCGDCGAEFVVLANGVLRSSIGFGCRGESATEYPELRPHPHSDREAWVHKDPGPAPDGSEPFRSRGIGVDRGDRCFVTGEPLTVGDNIAAFVDFKESGERIIAMFGETGGAWLDYRDYEPTYIQVKVTCGNEHVHCLRHLHELTVAAGGRITASMIAKARSLRDNGPHHHRRHQIARCEKSSKRL